MAIEANDDPFSINVIGETSDERWTGDFRAKKRLSHRDQLVKDQRRRELLGSQPGTPTDRALSTAMILSELSVRLTKTPAWWTSMGDGLDASDDNLIGHVFDKAMEVERVAAEAKKKAAEAAQDAMRKEAAEKAAEEAKSL